MKPNELNKLKQGDKVYQVKPIGGLDKVYVVQEKNVHQTVEVQGFAGSPGLRIDFAPEEEGNSGESVYINLNFNDRCLYSDKKDAQITALRMTITDMLDFMLNKELEMAHYRNMIEENLSEEDLRELRARRPKAERRRD